MSLQRQLFACGFAMLPFGELLLHFSLYFLVNVFISTFRPCIRCWFLLHDCIRSTVPPTQQTLGVACNFLCLLPLDWLRLSVRISALLCSLVGWTAICLLVAATIATHAHLFDIMVAYEYFITLNTQQIFKSKDSLGKTMTIYHCGCCKDFTVTVATGIRGARISAIKHKYVRFVVVRAPSLVWTPSLSLNGPLHAVWTLWAPQRRICANTLQQLQLYHEAVGYAKKKEKDNFCMPIWSYSCSSSSSVKICSLLCESVC